MPPDALAYRIPLAAGEEPAVEPVADDIDSCDLVYAHSEKRVIDMIEEERCFISPDGTHTYRNLDNFCCHCGMAAPWVRRDACRS